MAFSFHYRPYFAHLPRRQRVAFSFLMGDTNFALFIRRFPQLEPGYPHEDYFLGCAVVTYGVWQLAIITGIVTGHGIPASWGLGFAGTMALLALTCYAPIAALAAVVAPELVMTQGHLVDTWRDARIFGALAGLMFYAWKRSLFGTIVCGTGVMLALRFGLGW